MHGQERNIIDLKQQVLLHKFSYYFLPFSHKMDANLTFRFQSVSLFLLSYKAFISGFDQYEIWRNMHLVRNKIGLLFTNLYVLFFSYLSQNG